MMPTTIAGKIAVATLTSVALSTGVALFVQRLTIHNQGIELTRNTMRAAVMAAENTRASVSKLRSGHAFNEALLVQEAKASSDFRQTDLYRSVPVVSAWNSIAGVARKEGFEFRVPKHRARNPQNEPTPEEAAILDTLERSGQEEYFAANRSANLIVYARPIRLTADCLVCHGDPANSPTHDGKDSIGFAMEGWKEGELHGAFVLKAHLDQVATVASAQAQSAAMQQTVLWMVPTAILIGVMFLWYSRRSIIAPLSKVVHAVEASSSETTAASNQIAASSQSLAQSATEQASSIESIQNALDKVAEEARAAAAGVAEARELANRTGEAAVRGTEQMQQMQSAMQDIQTASDSVSRIIRTIDEIAFQTNILALNAAVEAARAGESGAGFAVVADEVRSLAQRSAQAAKETAELVGNSLQRTTRGVEICTRVAQQLKEIEDRGKPLNGAMDAIAGSAGKQRDGVEQVHGSVAEMNGVIQSLAAAAEESAAASGELNAQSESLKQSITEMTVLVGQ
jgi:methyl-accepting chemotaxis protein